MDSAVADVLKLVVDDVVVELLSGAPVGRMTVGDKPGGKSIIRFMMGRSVAPVASGTTIVRTLPPRSTIPNTICFSLRQSARFGRSPISISS